MNETLRLCELHYSKGGFKLTRDTWKDVETVSQIANYPHKQANDTFYVSGHLPYYTIRIYQNGKISVYSQNDNTVAVTFNITWHY